MSETETSVVPEGPSAGTLLRQAREAAGLHVSTLAANLKVPVRKLEALEEDRYEELPDAVFVRALASSVCRTLKVDATPVLQRLPQTPQPRLAQGSERINAPFRSPSDGPAPGLVNQVSRPVVLVVVALLLGALVLILLPLAQRTGDTAASIKAQGPQSAATSTARPEQPTTAPAVASSAVASGLPAAPSSAAGAVPNVAAITQGPEVPASAPAGVQLRTSPATAPAPAAPPVAAASSAAPVPATAASAATIDAQGVIVFRARAQSWVQVKDARGATVMQKLLNAGETVGASGALPLSVTVGSAQSTDVQVRGQPFDIAPLARDNVARFQVK